MLRPDPSRMGFLRAVGGALALWMPGKKVGTIAPPKVSLSCVSEAGTATLCGIAEYTTPSTPPKKYRIQTLTGIYKRCQWNNAANCTAGGATGFLVADWREYSGTWTYNKTTCANSNTQVENDYTGVTGAGCPAQGTLQATNAMTAPPFPPINSGAGIVVTVTPTSWTWTGPGSCQPVAKFSGTVNSTLTDEDTEDDAIARAVGTTPGTSCMAKKEPRGAGDFDLLFVLVAYSMACSSLVAGHDYRITYLLLTETYGGGGGAVTTHTVDFTAAGPTHTVSDLVPCASGKQATVYGVTISRLS